MTITTRDTAAANAPAAKTPSRPKTSSKSKASSKSKTASRTNKSTSRTPQKAAPVPPNGHDAFQVPATPSPGTASPDLIEASNDYNAIRRLLQSELTKIRDAQPNTERTKRLPSTQVPLSQTSSPTVVFRAEYRL